jgi:predicted transcriptional regulator
MMSKEAMIDCLTIKTTISKHVKSYLKMKCLRKKDLARKANVSLSTLNRVLDENNIKVRLRSLIRVLHATETELLISLERY